MWLVRERLGEPAELLARSSAAEGGTQAAEAHIGAAAGSTHAAAGRTYAAVSRARAATGLLRGGLDPREVADAVRARGRTGGARAQHPPHVRLAGAGGGARSAGASVVLHLHQYRLVCAVGVCFTRGEECVRCHGRNTLPGVLRNCRGSRGEALAYGAGLALWQRRVVEQADAVIVPSEFARERLRALGAPLPWERVHVLAPPVRALAEQEERPDEGRRRVGVDGAGRVGCRRPTHRCLPGVRPPPRAYRCRPRADVRRPRGRTRHLRVCAAGSAPVPGEGDRRGDRGVPQGRHPAGGRGRGPGAAGRWWAGARCTEERSASSAASTTRAWRQLRAGAALALVPSRSAETFGLAAAEAMAAGLPVAGSRVGALPELVGRGGSGAAGRRAARWRQRSNACAATRARASGRSSGFARCVPRAFVAGRLAEVYRSVAG